jgi:arylsulfatase A
MTNTSRPNIVFVLADDMGYGDFGMFNHRSKTPALDQIAADGISLTQHYSAAPVCTPARAALLTGRYPHRTGAIEMRACRGYDRLKLDERTIADMLRLQGYKTGLIGKWHTGTYGDEYHPNRRGFDEFTGFRAGGMDYFNWRIERNGQFQASDGQYLTDVLGTEAVDFVRRNRSKPFFLCLHFNAPHEPLQAPEDELKPFLAPDLNRGVSLIYAMISRMDRCIAKVREELQAQGLTNNTLFLFSSDNGPAFYESNGMQQERFNCGFAGSKGSVLEGGIRVPMIATWPGGGISGGRRFDGFVHFTDWLPSMLSAAGCETPKGIRLDGVNVLPAFQGDKGKVNPVRFWQWNRYSPVAECNCAMRDGDWKLVRPQIPEAMATSREEMKIDRNLEMHPEQFIDIIRTPEPQREIRPLPPELYNIAQDPCETRNLAAENPDRVRRMSAAIDAWFEDVERDRLREVPR